MVGDIKDPRRTAPKLFQQGLDNGPRKRACYKVSGVDVTARPSRNQKKQRLSFNHQSEVLLLSVIPRQAGIT